MNQAKIRLSAKEMELVNNADWILTKNGIIQKAKQLLETLQDKQRDILDPVIGLLPTNIALPPPKISKGENYQGLPYLVLDYPRYFDREHVFAIRTMFWWGHFFSTTLHLSGNHKKWAEQRITAAYGPLSAIDSWICINEGEWEHHFEADNYAPVRQLGTSEWEKIIAEKYFIKLAQKIPLQQWDEAGELLSMQFHHMISLVTGQLPRR
jgi:hypothetical protein